jgi:hypothetical protein
VRRLIAPSNASRASPLGRADLARRRVIELHLHEASEEPGEAACWSAMLTLLPATRQEPEIG